MNYDPGRPLWQFDGFMCLKAYVSYAKNTAQLFVPLTDRILQHWKVISAATILSFTAMIAR